MIDLYYWYGYPYHFGHASWGFEPRDGDYFVFAEDAGPVLAEGAIGPDERPITIPDAQGKEPWRIRSGGIRVITFLGIMNRFRPLDHEDVGALERSRRRDELLQNLEGVPLPLLDLYLSRDDHVLPFFDATLTPGSWHIMGVRSRRLEDWRLPVFVGAADLPPTDYRPGALEFLAAVPPYLYSRLRDIFSLVHVPDAGIEDLGGDEPPGPPDRPDDGGGEGRRLRTFDEAGRAWSLRGELDQEGA